MPRTKLELITQITTMRDEMSPMILRTGLTRNIFLIHESSGLFPMAFVREGYKWIKAIFDGPFQKAQNVRKQVSEEQWESYATMVGLDCEEFTEVIELNKALVQLRKAVSSKSRPDFFKREAQRVEVRKKR